MERNYEPREDEVEYVPTGRVDDRGVAETTPVNITPVRYFVKQGGIDIKPPEDKGNLVDRTL